MRAFIAQALSVAIVNAQTENPYGAAPGDMTWVNFNALQNDQLK